MLPERVERGGVSRSSAWQKREEADVESECAASAPQVEQRNFTYPVMSASHVSPVDEVCRVACGTEAHGRHSHDQEMTPQAKGCLLIHPFPSPAPSPRVMEAVSLNPALPPFLGGLS